MAIPFNSLKTQLAPSEPALREAFERVLQSGWYLMGPEAQAFEQEFAAWMDTESCVSLNSGTDALVLALKALDCTGGEVILPSHTALPCYHAVLAAGCTPVFAEVDEQSYGLSVQSAERMISSTTRAIIGVHLYGHPCDATALQSLCRDRGLLFIEDCAQAHGATIGGRRVGSIGDLAAFSFYPTKNLGALGDAGAVCGASAETDKALRLLKQYGEAQRYQSVTPGINSRMDELQAAFLRARLHTLEADTSQRQALAAAYDKGLQGLPLTVPTQAEGCTHVYHLYVIRTKRRDELAAFLKGREIGTAIHYPVPGHLQPLFAQAQAPCRADDLALTQQIAGEILSLPLYPGLGEDNVNTICQAIRDFFDA